MERLNYNGDGLRESLVLRKNSKGEIVMNGEEIKQVNLEEIIKNFNGISKKNR